MGQEQKLGAGATAVIRMRRGGGLGERANGGGGEKWLDSVCILKAAPAGFASAWGVECEGKRGVHNDTRILA